jgi:LCP family protein required for cell wall assembly
MLMTLLVPGSAQLVAGNRQVGRIAMRVWLSLLGIGLLALLTSLAWSGFAFWAGSNTALLGLLRLVLMAAAVGWAALIVDAWRIGQPLTLQRQHRLAVVGVNGVLCFSVAGSLLFGAHMVEVQRDFMVTMFGEGSAAEAEDGRYNMLLLGGDAGAGRWGFRPDSMTVASVDARTGETTLISLPRNMTNFPFAEGSVMDKEFPDGFDADYLNGVATWAADNTELFKGSENPGVDATEAAVEGITGLEIHYWALVNLEGFKDLVDAFGGVTLKVRDRIPVGLPHDSFFRYIEPGTRRLDGTETLWFARARYGSDDYSRMARQKCVMGAMLHQVSPQTALRNFGQIAQASSDMVSTSIPRGEAARFVQLALMAREQKISTLSLVPPLVNTADPDIDLIHEKVQESLAGTDGTDGTDDSEGGEGETAKKRKPRDASTTGGSLGNIRDGYVANQAKDLGAAC